MYTTLDERVGVVKTEWKAVRERVGLVDKYFTELVDKVFPGKEYPLYLLYLPFGMLKGDTESSFLPTLDGRFCKLSDPDLPKDLIQDIGYGKSSSPLGMILENQIEYFIEIEDQIIPYDIANPGTIFNKSILLNKKLNRNYIPNGVLKASAGSRTAFSLPSINSYNNLIKLGDKLNCKISAPRKSSDHWHIFKQISWGSKSPWRVCMLYFSEKWIQALLGDPDWIELKTYITEKDRELHQYDSNNVFYEIFYSFAQNKHNLSVSNPYITNTVLHLIKIALGEAPGYIPATTEEAMPLSVIQNALCEFYDIDSHPTIMTPHKYKFENDDHPIYYSLQHPTMPSFSIKRNSRVTANNEILAINYIMPSLIQEMLDESSMMKNTVLSDLAKKVKFKFFHNVPTNKDYITGSSTLKDYDKRFIHSSDKTNKKFCHEGKFLRGCVMIHS